MIVSTIARAFQSGDIVMSVIILYVVFSIAVFAERAMFFYRNSRMNRRDFMGEFGAVIRKNNFGLAIQVCNKANTPFSRVVEVGILLMKNRDLDDIRSVMERQKFKEIKTMRKNIGILNIVANTAFYIGLFGTILGIIGALQGGMQNSSVTDSLLTAALPGIVHALMFTVSGICVVLVSSIAYYFIQNWIENFSDDMEICISETLDMLKIASVQKKWEDLKIQPDFERA